ncbi:MAG: hypothetical protein RBT68_14130, partial [Spirochaetia bacterium]|nr:hypothetical protein [Spirochaetia bacterium]
MMFLEARKSVIPAILICLLLAVTVHAQAALPGALDEPAWLSLERGKRLFNDKDFGEAYMAFELAVISRRETFQAAAERLEQVMESTTAQEAGDSIQRILEAFAAEEFILRDYAAMVAASQGSLRRLLTTMMGQKISDSHRAFITVILQVLEYRPASAMEDSISVLGKLVGLLARYPEAEYWKGRVFMVEGELGLAEFQFRRADEWRESLENPGERSTILYSLLDLYEARGDMVAWEETIRILRADDQVEQDPFLREAMISTLRNPGFDRFMLLYRIEPTGSLDANRRWSEFLLERGRINADLYAAVAVNMVLTRAISMLKVRDPAYVWAGLDDFLAKAYLRSQVVTYLQEHDLNRMLLVLADALYVSSARQNALTLWRFVSA